MLSVVIFAAVGVWSQAPTRWTENIDILYVANQPGAVSMNAVAIPYLEGSMLEVDVINPQANLSFSLCMKQNVAMPAASNIANWPGQCAVYNFEQPTTVAAAKRAVYSSGALRGVGSDASAHGVGASASAAVAYNHGLLERRALVGNWSATAVVRVGNYYATLIATTAPTVNTTITLRLTGMQCAAGGYGPACEVPAQLTDNVPMVVNTPATTSTLLTLDGSFINGSTQALDITLTKTGNTTGVAYVRWSAPPVAVAGGYDLMLTLGDGTTSASVASPRPGTWFLMLDDTDNKTVLTTNVTLSAPFCTAGTVGAKCNTQFITLGAGGVVNDVASLTTGAQVYAAFAAKSALSIAAAADDSPSVPSLYAKLGGLPTTSDYDFANCNVASCGNQVTLKVPTTDVPPALQDEQWYVLIVANGDGGVSVWNADACANNCNGDNGSCNVATSTCVCGDDYDGFDCSTSKSALERWEWALIIGGGVLVAIALIGCIVYFIQKQNRRKGFERV